MNLTPKEFMFKLNDEGGIEDLINYGLDDNQIPPQILSKYKKCQKAIRKFYEKLDELDWKKLVYDN